MWRFGIVGATNVAINFVVFNALVIVIFAGSELKANLVATAFATTTSYLMNRSWTFRHRKTSKIPREYVLFFAFNGAALLIELAVMGVFKYGFGMTSLLALNLAKALGLALGTVFRFYTYRTFVFAGRPESATPADPATASTATASAVTASAVTAGAVAAPIASEDVAPPEAASAAAGPPTEAFASPQQ